MPDFTQYKLSAIPSPEDPRDYVSTAIIPRDIQVPSKLSYRYKDETVLDQGVHGICVGCGCAEIKNVHELAKLPVNGFSPVYVYALCKQVDGIPDIQGTFVRTGMAILAKHGTIPYDEMPISILNASGGKLPMPTQEQMTRGAQNRIAAYATIPFEINAIKQAMVSTKGPVKMIIAVGDSFYWPEQGKFVGKPKAAFYGAHDITVVSFDDDMMYTYADGTTCRGMLEVKNSWSKYWGNGGFAYIPYDALNWRLPNKDGTGWGIGFITELWSTVDDLGNNEQQPEPDVVRPKYWRIQTGAFSVKANAQNYQAQLKQKSLATYLVLIDNLWKVQLGAFLSEQNCRNESGKIKTLGVNNFVTYY